MTKTDSTFPALSLRIVDFEVQFFLQRVLSIMPEIPEISVRVQME